MLKKEINRFYKEKSLWKKERKSLKMINTEKKECIVVEDYVLLKNVRLDSYIVMDATINFF